MENVQNQVLVTRDDASSLLANKAIIGGNAHADREVTELNKEPL